MKKLRASYSLLNAFEKNQIDLCVDMYLHKQTFRNQGMEDGVTIHKQFEAEINKNKKLKLGKYKFEFTNPKCELKKYVNYNDFIDLSVVFDVVDEPILYEWKTGASTGSMEYATKEQIPMYFLACELLGYDVKTAKVVHYNQETNDVDITIVHNTPFKRDLARNYIETLAPEIYQDFERRGIL